MSDDDFLYFVEMPRRPVTVMEFAGLLSVALHGDGDTDMALIERGVVIMDVEEKARAGLLTLRDATTLSASSFVQGEALWRLVVLPADARAYLASRQIGLRIIDAMQGAEAVPTAADDHATHSGGPPTPVSTGDIAFAFDGLKWTADKWKKPLADLPKWLEQCVIQHAGHQGAPRGWNPVLIGAALIRQGNANPRSIRARFQTKPQLSQWYEAWKDYESEYFNT